MQLLAEPDAAFEAVLLEGDCIELIAKLVGPRADRFDLVYADPPFNAGTRRAARVTRGERARGAPAYRDAWGGLDAFLSMLEPRLAAMRDAMSERGSLWLHLDHRTVHDAKVLADRVFGRGAFQGEVVWVPGNGARRRRGPSVTHQTILVYSRTSEMIYNGDDPALREPYARTSQSMHFRQSDAAGRRFRERRIGGKAYRYYADVGRKIGSVWSDCPAMRANTPINAETTGYPTQKPERLLERIVRAASLPGSRVLDPMCGSGTTLAVAARLGRRAAGIDLSPLACKIARQRLGDFVRPNPARRARRQ
jgi:site-specific DNA-methyltransferase (adenine-specific)